MLRPGAFTRPPLPWVINLEAAGSPIQSPSHLIPGIERYHRYQLSITQEGRTRYRLCMGPFKDESGANAILSLVRPHFPASFARRCTADDLRVMAAMQKAALASEKIKNEIQQHAAQCPVSKQPSAPVEIIPPHVRIELRASGIRSLLDEGEAPRDSADAVSLQANTVSGVKRSAPAFDQRQTVGGQTPGPGSDEPTKGGWFSIELTRSALPFSAATLPNLDIFTLFRLYAVRDPTDAERLHSLRLGFFRSELDALTVARYLSEHYDSPAVKGISTDEYTRFLVQRIDALKPVDGTGTHLAIELRGDTWRDQGDNNA